MPVNLEHLLNAYNWFDHVDGPKFAETHRDEYRSCGHWLFLPGVFSSFHKLMNNEELWLIHTGRLLVHVIAADGSYHLLRLGSDLPGGERPVVTVPVNAWQAAEIPAGVPFAFGSNVCAPAFSYGQFEVGQREEMLRQFPTHASLIRRLTRTVQDKP
ncbi:MAG: cupin domain-containing protein [Chloroflexota bacterium]